VSHMSGVVVVDKPAGITSHDVVRDLRRVFGTRKIGHAGTLDPMATGVLVLGVNSGTRTLGHLTLTTKAYRATIRLGASSSTDDAEGTISAITSVEHLTDSQIRDHLAQQVGTIWQRPSSVSAIKVNGKRAHALVRAGESVELPQRQVTIESIDVDKISHDGVWCDITVNVVCSSGTYIRAIARDLGESLEVGGHLTALRRTAVGPFGVERSHSLESIVREENPWSRVLDLGSVAQMVWPSFIVDESQEKAISLGQRIPTPDPVGAGTIALLNQRSELLALGEVKGDVVSYKAVFVNNS
jgi:tRNA pseudouridine55 synthase